MNGFIQFWLCFKTMLTVKTKSENDIVNGALWLWIVPWSFCLAVFFLNVVRLLKLLCYYANIDGQKRSKVSRYKIET